MKLVVLEAGTLGADVDLSSLQCFGELEVYEKTAPEEIPERIRDATVVLVNKLPVDKKHFGEAKKLSLVCVTATGVNNLDMEYLKSRGVAACNISGYSTEAVAQHTFALLLYLWEKLRYYDDFVKSGQYAEEDTFCHFGEPFFELAGKTWGIIGMGAIGSRVASIAAAFGCRVICYSASGHIYHTPYEQVDWETLLQQSDIISIHSPLNQYTEHLMDQKAFARMKSSAYLINVARGPIVDEKALYTALQEKRIAGAALDVLEQEPMSRENPLGKIKDSRRLLITPHMAWAPVETRSRMVEEVRKNIQAFLDGTERNRVC